MFNLTIRDQAFFFFFYNIQFIDIPFILGTIGLNNHNVSNAFFP